MRNILSFSPAQTCVAPGGNCQAVDETTPCLYEFAPIPWAGFCPMGGGGSDEFDMGWVFVIIVLCGLFLYFVLGIIILKVRGGVHMACDC